MKKVLSLVLVIAMVLSCVPFAFAEDEAVSEPVEIPAVWASYDAGEAFAVDTTQHTFTTDAAASYPNGTLPAKASSIWSVGRYEHGTGYDRFSKYGYLLRAGYGFRANEDTVNTTLNLTENATIEPVRLANMVWTQNATVKLEKTTETYHPHTNGSAAVYGDGGYSIPDPNSYSATLGYSFGNTIIRENSSLGYQNEGSVHPAIRFVAPATGLIRPTLLMKGSVNVAWQIFKLDATGSKTAVYPAKGAESVSIVTPDASVTVPEKWATGWASMPASYTTFDSETIWVEAGDTLELRFAAKGPEGKGGAFTLATYVLDYINPITEWAVEYDASQTLIDFRAQRMFGMDTDLASTDLVETDVDGVFEIPADFVSGTTVTVTEAYLGTTHVIKATLTKSVNHYDAGDGFAVDTEKHPFTGNAATDYPNASLPAKKSPFWIVGRYGYNSGNYDYFAQYGKLHRVYVYNKAYEDDKSGALQLDPNHADSVGKDTTRYPVMAWSSNSLATLSTTELIGHWSGGGKTYGDGGYAFNGVGGYNGILGYGFNTAFAKENSSLGYQNSGSVHPAIIFTAPKTGLVRPTLKLSGPLGVVYKLYKIDSTGATTNIYPASAEESVSIVSPHADVPNLADKWKNGWTHIPSARTTRDSEVIWVEAGDKIELRFAASGPEGKNQPFDLNYFAIDYANPMVSEVVARYHGDERVVDLREFKKLPGNHDMVAPEGLTETETDGVFMVNEDFVSGTVVSFAEKQGDITHLIRVTLEEWATSFDLAELFETTQTFTGVEADYPQATLPVAMVNDGSQIWSVGHYGYSSNFIFSYYNRLFRSGTNSRSPQDTTNTRPTRMTYTI
ncbi:MAG: hypothetical protein J6D04_04120, partial [Clostridia bacterium]|nr:hypothetical protein [Clostridia bacterium]